jgi:hypothetical protein
MERVLTTSNKEGYKEGATYTSTLQSPFQLLHTRDIRARKDEGTGAVPHLYRERTRQTE